MKRFNDLTNEEKIQLTTEQVQYYAKLECAATGVIIPQRPVSSTIEVIAPTAKFYSIGYESTLFDNEKDVDLYVELLSRSYQAKGITNEYGVKNQYASKKDTSSMDYKSALFYTPEEAKEIKEVMLANVQANKEWADYDKSLSEYNKIERELWDNIDEIIYENSRIEYYTKVYNDYLELANQDASIAHTFFQKAYGELSLNDLDKEIVDRMLKETVKIN